MNPIQHLVHAQEGLYAHLFSKPREDSLNHSHLLPPKTAASLTRDFAKVFGSSEHKPERNEALRERLWVADSNGVIRAVTKTFGTSGSRL